MAPRRPTDGSMTDPAGPLFFAALCIVTMLGLVGGAPAGDASRGLDLLIKFGAQGSLWWTSQAESDAAPIATVRGRVPALTRITGAAASQPAAAGTTDGGGSPTPTAEGYERGRARAVAAGAPRAPRRPARPHGSFKKGHHARSTRPARRRAAAVVVAAKAAGLGHRRGAADAAHGQRLRRLRARELARRGAGLPRPHRN